MAELAEEEEQYQSPSDDELESESEYEGEDVEIPAKRKREDAIYNTAALHEKLEEIGWPDNVHWTEKLAFDYKSEGKIDANDDLAREMAFYTQALECAREAYEKFQGMGVPFLRPPDYYAEMVKSDSHMLKVKDKLLFQKQKMEEAEERRKAREAKKLAKAVQAQKVKERAQQKKRDIESVKKWRKMREKSGFTPLGEGGGEMPFDVGDDEEEGEGFPSRKKQSFKRTGVAPWDRSGGKAKQKTGWTGKGKGNIIQKREYRNKKFGHGGPKRFKKQNTAESNAGFSWTGDTANRRDKKRKRSQR